MLQLYKTSARNFVLYNVLPLDRAPEFKAVVEAKKAEVGDYNNRLASMISKFVAAHKDATVWNVEMNALFNDVLNDPARFSQTSGYKVLHDTCQYYSDNWLVLPSMTYKHSSCPYSVDKYFWLNPRHVSYPAHDLLAKVTADALGPAV